MSNNVFNQQTAIQPASKQISGEGAYAFVDTFTKKVTMTKVTEIVFESRLREDTAAINKKDEDFIQLFNWTLKRAERMTLAGGNDHTLVDYFDKIRIRALRKLPMETRYDDAHYLRLPSGSVIPKPHNYPYEDDIWRAAVIAVRENMSVEEKKKLCPRRIFPFRFVELVEEFEWDVKESLEEIAEKQGFLTVVQSLRHKKSMDSIKSARENLLKYTRV